MWTSNDMRHELRGIARNAIAMDVTRRILVVDRRISAALDVLGYESLDDVVNEDLAPRQRAFFQDRINERVMLADVGQEAHDACRAIAEGY